MTQEDKVLLAHGSGGTMMKQIIDKVFFEGFGGDILKRADDAANLDMGMQPGDRLSFSTDSFVVSPLFFPGADIGRLAVCGTVNDVASAGAEVLYLSCGFILEEGLALTQLQEVVRSMAKAAEEAGVQIVTGDTKVIERSSKEGSAIHKDGPALYINTSGVGRIPAGVDLSGSYAQPGDKILVSGSMGDHGIAIMSQREELGFMVQVKSDAAPLNGLIKEVLQAAPHTRAFRDPTRGGLASTLNEFAQASCCDIILKEESIPVKEQVRAACDMLGYEVLQVANEGKMVAVVPADEAEAALAAMQAHPYGRDAAIIGEVQSCADGSKGMVLLETPYKTRRILDMLVGEQLPRIC